jgi:ribonuclease Y
MSVYKIALIMLALGGALGYFIRSFVFLLRKNSLELTVSERLMKAKLDAQKLIDDANKKIESEKDLLALREREAEQEFKVAQERLHHKEMIIDERGRELDERSVHLDEKFERITTKERLLEELETMKQRELQAIAGMSEDEAYETLIEEIKHSHAEDLLVRSTKLARSLDDTLKEKAKAILATAIQRLAVPTTSELTTATITLPSDEIKGKIIGREGRNIRTFERTAGVELLVDETPGAIVISSFDPVRRAIAARALQSLVDDGRIQPAKIEEELELARADINNLIKQKGEEAVYELGIVNFDPRLLTIIGRLHFRTSYGQNVLAHSIEMAHIAGMLAAEIGADVGITKAAALVHDIGKALDHEIEGTHIDIGIRILRRFGADERIITAMKSHHDDWPHESIEAVIVQTADMISGARPGARRDTAEAYIKRLQELEGLAGRFAGVEKVYALQAGREIRIFVEPTAISDFDARTLARSIALNIEQELRYPGEIKVTVIRETRIIDYAR